MYITEMQKATNPRDLAYVDHGTVRRRPIREPGDMMHAHQQPPTKGRAPSLLNEQKVYQNRAEAALMGSRASGRGARVAGLTGRGPM